MSDDTRRYVPHIAPTPERPLQGMTVLLVEDSRLASEAIRLLCLRSGARIRRADSIAAAHRHLAVYRPTIAIVDMGLPDGSGAEIIGELAGTSPKVPALIGSSGDPGSEAAAMAAGADAFLHKPVESLAVFQQTILAQLGEAAQVHGPRLMPREFITPDPIAYEDDLAHAAEMLRAAPPTAGAADYVAQFLGAVARSAHDADLERAAGEALAQDGAEQLAWLVKDRLARLRAG